MSGSSDLKEDLLEHMRGLENFLVPSFTPDLRHLDEAGIRLDVRQSIRHGASMTALALEAGLTPEEQRRFISIACEEGRARIAVSVLLGSGSQAQTVELLAHAREAGVSHAHLGCPPQFAPRDDREVIEYVLGIVRGARLPVCLVAERFTFPALHPSGIPLEAFERLAEEELVVGLDLASLDAGLIEECCERLGNRLFVSSPHIGLLPMLVQSLALQRAGPFAFEGLQSPERPYVVQFFEALLAGRASEAMTIYWGMSPALGALAKVAGTFAHTGVQHWPLIKYQQWLSGGNGGLTRQPVMRLFERDMQAIRGGLAALGVTSDASDAQFFAGRAGHEQGASHAAAGRASSGL